MSCCCCCGGGKNNEAAVDERTSRGVSFLCLSSFSLVFVFIESKKKKVISHRTILS